MPLIESLAGLQPQKRGRGSAAPIGMSELSLSVIAQEAGARYTEAAWNGVLYTLSSGLVATPAAGPLGAAGTPLLALWNPAGSNYIAVITRVAALWTATGTVSGKGFELDSAVQAASITGAVTQPVANLVGAGADGDIKGFVNTALTASVATVRLLVLSGVGNAVAQNTVGSAAEDLQGLVVLQQGTFIALTALALGTANEAIASITYLKIKVS